jgi:hypothetical protein
MQFLEFLAENPQYLPLLHAGIGLVLGIVPMAAGIGKRKFRLGSIGLIASAFGGALAGIFLSIPAAAIFTWLILRRGGNGSSAEKDNE